MNSFITGIRGIPLSPVFAFIKVLRVTVYCNTLMHYGRYWFYKTEKKTSYLYEIYRGETLLYLVTLHPSELFAAHGLLVEFLHKVYMSDACEVKRCIREQLGSCDRSRATLQLYDR